MPSVPLLIYEMLREAARGERGCDGGEKGGDNDLQQSNKLPVKEGRTRRKEELS